MSSWITNPFNKKIEALEAKFYLEFTKLAELKADLKKPGVDKEERLAIRKNIDTVGSNIAIEKELSIKRDTSALAGAGLACLLYPRFAIWRHHNIYKYTEKQIARRVFLYKHGARMIWQNMNPFPYEMLLKPLPYDSLGRMMIGLAFGLYIMSPVPSAAFWLERSKQEEQGWCSKCGSKYC